jgi:hypothetical protein
MFYNEIILRNKIMNMIRKNALFNSQEFVFLEKFETIPFIGLFVSWLHFYG